MACFSMLAVVSCALRLHHRERVFQPGRLMFYFIVISPTSRPITHGQSSNCKWLTLPAEYATWRDLSIESLVFSSRCSMPVAVAAVKIAVLCSFKLAHQWQMQFPCAGCCKSTCTPWSFLQQHAAHSDSKTNNDSQALCLVLCPRRLYVCTHTGVCV